MQNCKNEIDKLNEIPVCKTKPNLPNLPNLTYQTKPTKPTNYDMIYALLVLQQNVTFYALWQALLLALRHFTISTSLTLVFTFILYIVSILLGSRRMILNRKNSDIYLINNTLIQSLFLETIF